MTSTKRPLLLVALLLAGACTSIAFTPPAAELPAFTYPALRGASVSITVEDRRGSTRDAGWERRVREDVARSLAAAGVPVSDSATVRLEIEIIRASSDAGHHETQWNACVGMRGKVTGAIFTELSGDGCITRSNQRGITSARDALHLAYEDALSRLLSKLDAWAVGQRAAAVS